MERQDGRIYSATKVLSEEFMTVRDIEQIFLDVEHSSEPKPTTPEDVRQNIISGFTLRDDLLQAINLIPILLASLRKTFNDADYYLLEGIITRLSARAHLELARLDEKEYVIQ